MSRVVLAMSGGVDSSVAAHLLRAAGHEVIGVFMRHGETVEAACATENRRGLSPFVERAPSPDGREQKGTVPLSAGGSRKVREPLPRLPVVSARADHKQGCCSASDAADARRVADLLDIPFYALNLSAEFGRIIDYFVAEYRSARTPNPCVVCNNWLKFGKLFEYADSVGAEFVATGHYARVDATADGVDSPALRRGLDASKDQSYVLFGVARRFLPRMMFPIGSYRKEEIRRIANELDLRVADKKDSQEICFVSSGDHADFVRRRAGDEDTSGEIVTTDGSVVGRHEGIEGFTIGQRKGLGVAFGEPRYVVRIEAASHRVVVGTRGELARAAFTAERANWFIDEPAAPLRCLAQIRYNSRATPATVEPLGDGRIHLTLDAPQHGVAPGQAVVCYDGDRVLGGGWIE
ncbi:MAG TPA: tRNA 2-thiouridine(34) synthase MnmA [Pirellulales bacterium]|nr:tRNA 2-thiouridine(34) synthase MnmA [Pirellulales bacterium]